VVREDEALSDDGSDKAAVSFGRRGGEAHNSAHDVAVHFIYCNFW